jgi:hypothetical protein
MPDTDSGAGTPACTVETHLPDSGAGTPACRVETHLDPPRGNGRRPGVSRRVSIRQTLPCGPVSVQEGNHA